MNYFKFTLVILAIVTFSSCLDSEEKIVINQDHSGMYTISLDMGRMLEMASTMGARPDSALKEKKDSVLYMKDMLNLAGNLTEEEKKLFRDAIFDIKLDERKNELKMVLSCPFSDIKNLTAIKRNLFTVFNKLKAFERSTGETSVEEAGGQDAAMGMSSINPVEDYFSFSAAPGKISNEVLDIANYKSKIATDSSLQMMQQMSGMMGDLNFRTIFVLPRAVKKYEGPGSIVSQDKKTVTFKTTLSDMMQIPEKASYKLEY